MYLDFDLDFDWAVGTSDQFSSLLLTKFFFFTFCPFELAFTLSSNPIQRKQSQHLDEVIVWTVFYVGIRDLILMKDDIFRLLFVKHFDNLEIYSFHFAILSVFEINPDKNIHVCDFHCHVRNWKAFNSHEYFCEAKLQTNQATSKQDNRADCMFPSEDKMQVKCFSIACSHSHSITHCCMSVEDGALGFSTMSRVKPIAMDDRTL